jgi:hypothetical protein
VLLDNFASLVFRFLVSALGSFINVPGRPVHITQDKCPRSQTLLIYIDSGGQTWKAWGLQSPATQLVDDRATK